MVDRYTKVVLTVIAISLVVISARPLFPITTAEARIEVGPITPLTPEEIAANKKMLEKPVVPRSWGRLAAVEHHPLNAKLRMYYFESSDGTVHSIEGIAAIEISRK